MSVPEHTVVLGGGPAGLSVAHELGANGAKVTVLERNDFVGGLCRTVHKDGYRFDLGGHRWFTQNEHLDRWFRRLMEGELVRVERISRIHYDGRFFSYPIRFGDIVRNASPANVVHAGASLCWAMLRQALGARTARNMEEAYTAQFGAKLYDMFFRRYSEKVWGRPCNELSADWVAQRSKGLSVGAMIRDSLLSSKTGVRSLTGEFVYPRLGYMRIAERMSEDVKRHGNVVMLRAEVSEVVYRGANDFEVAYRHDGADRMLRANAVVSTIPLGVLGRIIRPRCDATVEEAARALEFRDLITVNVRLKRRQVSNDTWVYIQDERILFGRMHEPKNWSADMVPDDEHTSLVLECFCTAGDHIWRMTDEAIVARCVDDLASTLKFIESSEVEGATVIRTRHAYPVYDLGYHDKIEIIQAFFRGFDGLHTVGRGGTFRYNNADHSIEMGLLLGRRLLGHDVDHLAVNIESAYHEEIREDTPARHHYRAAEQDPADTTKNARAP